ncbi:MAG: hypothetical protein ABSF65_05280 [Candidatus Bathyarchaeia archaeon]|jgi:hypothetical protein|nr:hypothetical protein [Candidatus Bathyarchaeia archaeon]
MVEIKSPIRLKDLEGKAGIGFKALLGLEGSKKELYDNDKMIIINLQKGECIAFMDSENKVWELSRNSKGRYSLRKLKK